MTEIKSFIAYKLGNNGERIRFRFLENELVRALNPEDVLIIFREDLHRIFIWKGAKSSVKKRFISVNVARELQKKLMKESNFDQCKIVSVDQGDEVKEFLDAFKMESMKVIDKLPDLKYIRNKDKPNFRAARRIFPNHIIEILDDFKENSSKMESNERFVEKKFKINKFLSLKLIKGRSIIFVNDEPFHQCKYLLLNLTHKDFKEFENIDSIDQAFEIYNKLEKKHEKDNTLIDPESEFIGHCSNLQAWFEHDYDLRILHSSLSIPLLKKLAFLGDQQAIVRLKESIATRIALKNHNTIIFYLNEEYLDLFSKEELEVIFEDWLEKEVEFTLMEKRRLWYPLLKEMIIRGVRKAKLVLKNEIVSYLKEDHIEAYRYLLKSDFLYLFNLKDLEEIYNFIPKKDKLSLRHIESLILKATLKKRRIEK